MLRLKPLVLTGLTAFAHMALLGELARAARLSWNDHSNNETGFSIERSWDGERWTEVGTVGRDVTEFEDVGLGAMRRLYYYRARAFNEYGYSGYTNVAKYSHEPNGQIFQGAISGEVAGSALLRLSGVWVQERFPSRSTHCPNWASAIGDEVFPLFYKRLKLLI
jgi:hypothetical protein